MSSSETNSITDYNKGIFIDIFPIDRIPDNQGDRENFFNAIKAERLAVIAEGRKIGVFSETQNKIQHFVKKVLYKILVKRRKWHLSDFYNFLGNDYYVPADAEKYLVLSYGKTWRIPQKGKGANPMPKWMVLENFYNKVKRKLRYLKCKYITHTEFK